VDTLAVGSLLVDRFFPFLERISRIGSIDAARYKMIVKVMGKGKETWHGRLPLMTLPL
jgi:hypothetical protein